MIAASLVTVDPGHFHASLVQNRTYADVDRVARVFAPEGAELDAHLKLVANFNSRPQNPTDWQEEVYRGGDYLEQFRAAAKAGKLGSEPFVVFSGRNDRKGDYVLAAVESGCNVLADKPLAINASEFAKLERAVGIARQKGLLFADIMTERNEITTILQRALSMDRALYGEQEKGTPDDPAVTKVSVHHYCKLVNGAPLKRPEWFYGTKVQGDGITDVTTHLVDLVQWETFPGVRLSRDDVKVVSARQWPTMISPEQFALSTGGKIDKTLAVNANGEFTWQLKGVNCKVSVEWHFMAPKGTGDTHYSLMRGTKAEIVIRQGEKEGYRPVLYVRSRGDAAATESALKAALVRIAKTWPGVEAVASDEPNTWRVSYPKKYDIGHEAHFSQVVEMFLRWMKDGREEKDYAENMLVKYYTINEARERIR